MKKAIVLGVITYDFFNIARILEDQNPPDGSWVPVKYPIALVLFGATKVSAPPGD